jgi:hypothetical protein
MWVLAPPLAKSLHLGMCTSNVKKIGSNPKIVRVSRTEVYYSYFEFWNVNNYFNL